MYRLRLCTSCFRSRLPIPTTRSFARQVNLLYEEHEEATWRDIETVLTQIIPQACFHWQGKTHLLFLARSSRPDTITAYGISTDGRIAKELFHTNAEQDFESFCRQRVSDLGYDIWLALSKEKREELTNGSR